MPISYSIHPKISEEIAIWKGKGRCQRNYKDIVPIQKGRNSRRSGMYRPRTFMCMYTTQDKRIRTHGISKGEECPDDIR